MQLKCAGGNIDLCACLLHIEVDKSTCAIQKRRHLRKEVIQPHLPVRLPCYDLVLLTSFTFADALLAVRQPTSGTPSSDHLTGGVYKTRERIHPVVADTGLLTIPAS
jgi:hypothetical protein